MRDRRLNCIGPSKYYECVIVFVLKRITRFVKKVFKKIFIINFSVLLTVGMKMK